MDRKSIVAMTLGTVGILAASTIAGLSIYNVAARSTVQARPALQATASAAAPDPIASVDLPALPIIEAPSADAANQPQTAGDAAPSSTSEPAAPADANPQAEAITRDAATALVLAEAPGSALKATATTRDGYRAWAVQVRRPDDSVVTGYVDRASGVLFAWRLDQAASTKAGDDDASENEGENEPGQQAERGDDDDHGSDEYESEHGDDDD